MCYLPNQRGKKYTLSLGTLYTLLSESKEHGLPAIMIGSGSEGMLYKNIKEALKAARNSNILDVWFSTNGTLLTKEIMELLVDEKIARIAISLDAATSEIYREIRGKDLLNKVESNIHYLLDVKRRKQSKLPIVRLSFCVQEANINECKLFVDKWKNVVDYIDFQALLDYGPLEQGVVKVQKEKDTGVKVRCESYCPLPFNSLSVWSNGDVTPCCGFYGRKQVLGKAGEASLMSIWKGDMLKQIREELLLGAPNLYCKVCLASRDRNKLKTTLQTFINDSTVYDVNH